MKNYVFTLSLILAVFMFMTGMWMIDIGASMGMIKAAGGNVVAEGLIFTGIEPRVIYHLGLMFLSGGFFGAICLGVYTKWKDT